MKIRREDRIAIILIFCIAAVMFFLGADLS